MQVSARRGPREDPDPAKRLDPRPPHHGQSLPHDSDWNPSPGHTLFPCTQDSERPHQLFQLLDIPHPRVRHGRRVSCISCVDQKKFP